MADKLMTLEEFDKVIHSVEYLVRGTWSEQAKNAYAAALARIAELEAHILTLEAQLDAMREQVDRLLAEAAHA